MTRGEGGMSNTRKRTGRSPTHNTDTPQRKDTRVRHSQRGHRLQRAS